MSTRRGPPGGMPVHPARPGDARRVDAVDAVAAALRTRMFRTTISTGGGNDETRQVMEPTDDEMTHSAATLGDERAAQRRLQELSDARLLESATITDNGSSPGAFQVSMHSGNRVIATLQFDFYEFQRGTGAVHVGLALPDTSGVKRWADQWLSRFNAFDIANEWPLTTRRTIARRLAAHALNHASRSAHPAEVQTLATQILD